MEKTEGDHEAARPTPDLGLSQYVMTGATTLFLIDFQHDLYAATKTPSATLKLQNMKNS